MFEPEIRGALPLLLLALVGCNPAPSTSQAPDDLEKRIRDLQAQVWKLETTLSRHDSAIFDPAAEPAFQRLNSSMGTFAVSVNDIRAHADGARVRLDVGNLTTATYKGAVFSVKWGTRFDSTTMKYLEWWETVRETKHKANIDLRPGAWNKVTLTLPGVPPEKLGYLELSMETDVISLHDSK
jgi:hypothetical protein